MSNVRFVHTIPGILSINISVGKNLIAGNVMYGETTGYLDLPDGKITIVITSYLNGSYIITATGKFHCNQHHTTVISENSLLVYTDRTSAPKHGTASIRFINASPTIGPVDFLYNSALIHSNVEYSGTGCPIYSKISLGSSEISIQTKGSTTILVMKNVFVKAGQILSAIFMTSNGKNYISYTVDNPPYCKYSSDVLQCDLDIQRYMNKWYQISSTAVKDCPHMTVLYTLTMDKIKVTNTCYDVDWKGIKSEVGSLIPWNWCFPSAMTLSLPSAPMSAINMMAPNYLIHKTDYVSYSVIGTPDRSALQILSREKMMEKCEFKKLLKFARSLGYNTSQLTTSDQI